MAKTFGETGTTWSENSSGKEVKKKGGLTRGIKEREKEIRIHPDWFLPSLLL